MKLVQIKVLWFEEVTNKTLCAASVAPCLCGGKNTWTPQISSSIDTLNNAQTSDQIRSPYLNSTRPSIEAKTMLA
jgi:hypothetical protein